MGSRAKIPARSAAFPAPWGVLAVTDATFLDYKPDFSVSGRYTYVGSMPAMCEFRIDARPGEGAPATVARELFIVAPDNRPAEVQAQLMRPHSGASRSFTFGIFRTVNSNGTGFGEGLKSGPGGVAPAALAGPTGVQMCTGRFGVGV